MSNNGTLGNMGNVEDVVTSVLNFLQMAGLKTEEIASVLQGVAARLGYVLDPRVAAQQQITTFLLGAGAGFVATKALSGRR